MCIIIIILLVFRSLRSDNASQIKTQKRTVSKNAKTD